MSELAIPWAMWPQEVPEVWPEQDQAGFVVIDLETTGLSPKGDRIIEVALIRADENGVPIGKWSSLVNPEREISASHVHGITDSDVALAPTFAAIADEVLDRIRGSLVVAHNASFDKSFLKFELARSGWELPEFDVACTMLESSHFLPGLPGRKLIDCVEAIGFAGEVRHRALDDATLASALLHFYLVGPMNQARADHLRQLSRNASFVDWPSERTFPEIQQSSKRVVLIHAKPKAVSHVSRRVSEIMPEDLLADDATGAEIAYCAQLLEAIEDGFVEESESDALVDAGQALGLSQSDLTRIHHKLVAALAFEAWHDGVVNRDEKREVEELALQIGLSREDAVAALKAVEELRAARIASRARAVPESWNLGEPLRVGDRVVFTGCYDDGRHELEDAARRIGLRVTGSVSRRTSLLVSDGTIGGNKERDAAQLGIRTVGPGDFRELLKFVQPGLSADTSSSDGVTPQGKIGRQQVSREVQMESLTCQKCGEFFSRTVSKGRKPRFCPPCR